MLTAIGGELEENESCEFVNSAGDQFFGSFAGKGDPSVENAFHLVHGAAKSADVTGGDK